MNKGYKNADPVLMRWLRVGWVVNGVLAVGWLLFSDEYTRAGICLISSVALAFPYFVANKRVTVRIATLLYLLLCSMEWTLLSYSLISVEQVLVEGRAYSFLLNFIVLILPFLYAGLRWIFGLVMVMELRKARNN